MKLLSITITFILSVLVCHAQEETNFEAMTNDTLWVQSKQDIHGLWRADGVDTVYARAFEDAAFKLIHYVNYIYFEGDSLWGLEYPCRTTSALSYSLDQFRFTNDSALRYVSYDRDFYSRYSYDTVVMSNLIRNKYNTTCFEGEWELERIRSGEDGTGIVLILPFQMEDTIYFNEEMFENRTMFGGKVVRVPVEGFERDFHFTLQKEQYAYKLILTPTNSWSEQDKQMWIRLWNLPAPRKKELKKYAKKKELKWNLFLENYNNA